MIKNYSIAIIFSIDKAADESEVLSVLAVQRGEEPALGKYAFPMFAFDGGSLSIQDSLVNNLNERLGLKFEGELLALGTESVTEKDDVLVCSSFILFMEQGACPVKGGVWFNVNADGKLSNRLAFNHNTLLEKAVRHLLSSATSPFGILSSYAKPALKDIIKGTFSEESRSSWVERAGELGLLDYNGIPAKDLPNEQLISILKGRDNAPYITHYFHPEVAVDIVVLALNDDNELVVPLIVRSEGEGEGRWGIPGAYLTEQDFKNAGWDGKDSEYKFKKFANYDELQSHGTGATRRAAKNILREKTGISIPDEYELLPLNLRDNPLRGAIDGSPVLAVTYLAILDRPIKPLTFSEDSKVLKADWFPVRRVLYNEKGVVKVCGDAYTDKVVNLSEKGKRYDLKFKREKAVAYIRNGNTLQVDYFQSLESKVSEEPIQGPKESLFCDHGAAIIDALDYIREQSRHQMIIPDFFGESTFEFPDFVSRIETILWPEEKVRTNLYDLVKIKSATPYGFLEKEKAKTYRIDRDKFETFLKSRPSTM